MIRARFGAVAILSFWAIGLSSQGLAPRPHVSLSRSEPGASAFTVEIANQTASAMSLDRMSPYTMDGNCKAKLDGDDIKNKLSGFTGGRYYNVGPHKVWRETVQLRRTLDPKDPARGLRLTQFVVAPQLTAAKHTIAFTCFDSEWSNDVSFDWSEK